MSRRLFVLGVMVGLLLGALLKAASTPPLIDGWTILVFILAAFAVVYIESDREDR